MNRFRAVCVALSCALYVFPCVGLANMLRNASFEEPAPSTSRAALHWSMHEPDTHGDRYGSASREDWRSRDGMNIMTVRGTWAHAGEYGGVWQEAEAEAGEIYRASAWFWADPDWDPRVQEMKLEFFSANHSELLKTKSEPLGEISTEWTRREITATAPEESAWIRVVISVEDAGDTGALQFDTIYLAPKDAFNEPEPKPVDVIIDVLDEPDQD